MGMQRVSASREVTALISSRTTVYAVLKPDRKQKVLGSRTTVYAVLKPDRKQKVLAKNKCCGSRLAIIPVASLRDEQREMIAEALVIASGREFNPLADF